jgi:acyl dehydratase
VRGRSYEECIVDEVVEHRPSRTVTETDNVLFNAITMNPQPLHSDYEFAAQSSYGRPLVNGLYTLALTLGLSVNDMTLETTAGNLGFSDIKYLHPVFFGDTLTADTRVVSKRLSETRPECGIVEFEHRARNQDGVVVLTCRRSGLMLRLDSTAGEASP